MGIEHLDNKLNILATVRPIMGDMVTKWFIVHLQTEQSGFKF